VEIVTFVISLSTGRTFSSISIIPFTSRPYNIVLFRPSIVKNS